MPAEPARIPASLDKHTPAQCANFAHSTPSEHDPLDHEVARAHEDLSFGGPALDRADAPHGAGLTTPPIASSTEPAPTALPISRINRDPIDSTNSGPSWGVPSSGRPRIALERALEGIHAHERDLREVRTTARTIRVEPGAVLLEDGSRFALTHDGVRRFCAAAGAPANYVLDLGQAVRAQVLQHALERGRLGETVTVVARGATFLGFRNPALLTLAAGDVFQAVVDELPADAAAYVDVLHVDDESVQIDILGDSVTEEMAPGDIVAAGVRLWHSTLGLGATRIESSLLRLVCANGLTHRDCVTSTRPPRTRRLSANHERAQELQREQVRRLVREAWSRLRAKLAVLRETQQEPLDVEAFLGTWLRRGGLSERRHLPRLLRAWEIEGRADTVWGAVNALTRYGTHDLDLTPHQRRVISHLAGIRAFRAHHYCPRCFTVLREPLADSAQDGVHEVHGGTGS